MSHIKYDSNKALTIEIPFNFKLTFAKYEQSEQQRKKFTTRTRHLKLSLAERLGYVKGKIKLLS